MSLDVVYVSSGMCYNPSQYITRVAQSPLVLVKGKLENMKVLPVHW